MRIPLASVAATVMVLSGIGVTPALAATVSTEDTMFLKAAHQGNLAEIAAGEDAQKHATTECVEEVGRVLVRDHTKLDSDVKMLASKLHVTLPNSPTAEQQKQLAAVQAKAGTPAYDAAWLKTQEAAHTATLALIDRELSVGRNAEVKAAARSARPVVAMHLDMVRGGVCHAGKNAGKVHAGTGGQLATDDNSLALAGVVTLAGGGLLATCGALWFLRNRRRSADLP
ncbi:DUF4142 domain-containing protein [Streptomyces sp. Wb2n-11]|uniref:DUF4142 domain-containing protein n=1 Tax=Streptomyces sp. Wb2n-11 TaxID=1030533 RepID=UPI000B28C417|nr:DUF4142 domain-containing protein [Streptomyces sp. Wb2n-11]